MIGSGPIHLVLALLLGALLAELVLRLPLAGTARELSGVALKAVRVMRSRAISDHWKERALLRYSQLTMAAALRLILVLSCVAAAALAAVWSFSEVAPGFEATVLSMPALVAMTLAALLHAKLRTRAARV